MHIFGRPLVPIVSVGVALFGLAVAHDVSGPTSSPVQAATDSLGGRWTTFANGDDVLTLVHVPGTLWAGTRSGGLVRWDPDEGTYKQYLRPQDPLGGNTVFDIDIDETGRLWLATDGGLTMFDDHGTDAPADDTWFTYTTDNAYGMPSDEVRAVAVDGPFVWVGGRQKQDVTTGDWIGGGLGRLDTAGTATVDDDSWAPIVTYEDTYIEEVDGTSEPGLVSDTINDIIVADEGNVWIGASAHWRYENLNNPDAPHMWQRVHGGMSVLDTKGTADPGDDRWHGFSCELLELTVTCNVNKLAVDQHGRAWAADGGRGLFHFDPAITQLPSDPKVRVVPPSMEGDPFVLDFAFGPSDDTILTNTVWLATRGGGVTVFDHNGTLANTGDDLWNFDRGGPFETSDGLSRDRIQAIAEGDGLMWVGAGVERGVAGGIHPFDPAELTIEPAWRTLAGPPSNFIIDVAFGEPGSRWEGHVWFGTGSRAGSSGSRLFGAGALDLDTRGTSDMSDDTWTRYDARATDDDGTLPWAGLAGDNVQAVILRGDEVWIGSAETHWGQDERRYLDGGLAVFDGTRWTTRPTDKSDPDGGLGGGGVSSLALGCEDELWVGTGNNWDHKGAGVYEFTTGPSVHDVGVDQWLRHRYPQLASANTSAVAVDCDRRRAWVGATHHINDSETGGPIGHWSGGGVAVFDLDTEQWARHSADDGIESFASSGIKAEILTIHVDPDGTARAGAYGTREMDTSALLSVKPYWPAVLNSWNGAGWTNDIFERAGGVASIARDGDDRLWVATSRGGAARESVNADNWHDDPGMGGLYVHDGEAWHHLDAARDGLPANDLSVVRVAPDGSIWVGTEGWGMAHYDPGAAAPTPTVTVNLPTRTPTPTGDHPEPTPTDRATVTGTAPPTRPTPTGPTPTATPARGVIYLPMTPQRR